MYFVKLLRKTNRDSYNNLNKKMLLTIESSGKLETVSVRQNSKTSSIILVQNDEILREETKVAITFNAFFIHILTNFKIPPSLC